MAIFRCKMCGGELEIQEGMSVCTCDYCGTKQTVSAAEDETIRNLYNRANVLRMKAEFDKAADVYEKILQQKDDEAEAYWGLILCKYGIEYVEDPKTGKRIPTCHRASYDPVVTDEDYKNALKYADIAQKILYEQEAEEIDRIQKGIIEVAQKTDPYDVFICYKETDENGKRTPDSVIGNDIYHQLTQEGFKVFYAPISLESKLGSEYEPYIFSALNTAKVMLVLGTKPEYFNAVWVKNEWSRFLNIMKKDRSRLLIPCYKDMDPYELPEEFAHLQAQDMGKIGFINDVVRGIRKVAAKEQAKPAEKEKVIVQSAGNTTANAQIQRGNMALEDHEWEKADSFFEEALNLDPQCAEAYLGKLLARDKKPGFASWIAMQKEKYAQSNTESLEACVEDTAHIQKRIGDIRAMALEGYLDKNTIRKLYEYDRSYESALSCRRRQKEKQEGELSSDRLLGRARQYASGGVKKQLEDALKEISAALEERITKAKEEDEVSISAVKAAYAEHLSQADKKAQELNQEAQQKRQQQYQDAVALMKSASDIAGYERARDALTAMHGYQDSNALAEECQKEADRLRAEQQEKERQEALRREAAEKAEKKRKTVIGGVIAAAAICIVAVLVVTKVIIPNKNYNAAVALMESGDYEGAIAGFTSLGEYKDATGQIEACQTAIKEENYQAAVKLMDSGDYEGAIAGFTSLGEYKDAAEQIEVCQAAIKKEEDYQTAVKLKESGDYIGAYEALGALNGYKDGTELQASIKDEYQKALVDRAQVGDSVYFGAYEQNNNTDDGKEDIEWVVLEKDGNKALLISKYALDCKQYNTEYVDVTWESCSLRKWLNGDFLKEAFSIEEQAMIQSTTVTADKNPGYSTDPVKSTKDQVFLLSIPEAEKYFSSDEARKCAPTAYAKAQGAYTSDSCKTAVGEASCWWWLRSPGSYGFDAAAVNYGGSVRSHGNYVDYDGGCVRPAFWIDLES